LKYPDRYALRHTLGERFYPTSVELCMSVCTSLRLAILFTLFCGTPLFAQESGGGRPQDEAQRSLEIRANTLLDETMKIVADRASDFNQHVADINLVRPLELGNLDSSTVLNSIVSVRSFLSYLNDYQSSNDSLARTFQDSLFAIRHDMPPGVSESALDAFEKSYEADHTAFNKYLTTLHKLYGQVLDVLTFLRSTPYTLSKTKLEFTKQADVNRYQELMRPIDATSRELKKAGEESRKATQIANSRIQDINKAQQQPKRKKK
jgi:hypothetical protein